MFAPPTNLELFPCGPPFEEHSARVFPPNPLFSFLRDSLGYIFSGFRLSFFLQVLQESLVCLVALKLLLF